MYFSLFLDKTRVYKDEIVYSKDESGKQDNTEGGIFMFEKGDLHIKKSVLEQFKVILEDWIPEHALIAIAVEKHFVYFSSQFPNLSLEIGSVVPEDSIAYKVLQQGEKVDAMMDNSLFESPYYAIGYPLTVNDLPGALVIVLPSLFKKETPPQYRHLTGKHEEDWVPVMIDDISHIESLQKRTWFNSNGTHYKTAVTLKELQLRLPENFIRIHRSYIINICFIERIYRDLTSNYIVKMKDGTELPISQSYLSEVRKVLEF